MQTHTQHTRKHAHIQSYITHAFTYKIHGLCLYASAYVLLSCIVSVYSCIASVKAYLLQGPEASW
jgi:hypothetical protein